MSIKAVVADIDATGTIEPNRVVGIRYVSQKGHVSDMLVSKRTKQYKRNPKRVGAKKSSPINKMTGLIPIIDHTDEMKPKDIFIYGIIRYAPDGDLDNMIKVKVA